MKGSSFLVTGGAGFIGSHLVKELIDKGASVICLDWMTYAGNPENLLPHLRDGAIVVPETVRIPLWVDLKVEGKGLRVVTKEAPFPQFDRLSGYELLWADDVGKMVGELIHDKKLVLVVGSVADRNLVRKLIPLTDGIFHLAAETHVDRSILDPEAFLKTDVLGTFVMLEALRKSGKSIRFLHVSTDEIYGEIRTGRAIEDAPLNPRNPYSAAKAAADRLAYSYFTTYNLDVVIARPSNNYGPYQHPEKLIPLMTIRALEDKPLPVYGDGKQIRDWIFVEDTVKALVRIFERGKKGEVYNIAGHNERENIEVVKGILGILGKNENLIRFVKDRPGHDRRYALDDSKLRKSLSFEVSTPFDEGLRRTVLWYKENRSWWENFLKRDMETEEYFRLWYGERGLS
jgi:dTDP-glucose 4,6-dehydratase